MGGRIHSCLPDAAGRPTITTMYTIIRMTHSNGRTDIYHGKSPTVLHRDYDSAKAEAERLAGMYPAAYFGIFKLEQAAVCPVSQPQFVTL